MKQTKHKSVLMDQNGLVLSCPQSIHTAGFVHPANSDRLVFIIFRYETRTSSDWLLPPSLAAELRDVS